MKQPDNFLDIVCHEINSKIGDELALCAGFERGEWRNDQFAGHIIEWLPEFALKHSELDEIGHHNAMKMVSKAAKLVYQTEKYGRRGEFGEILLHIAIRQVYETIPAITKIYYKTAANETVKGFDAVHIIRKNNELELWIGEAKFYKDVTAAITEACKEIVDHLETDYLRNEFLLIKNKIDPSWPEAEPLRALLHENVSLDDVFKRACIPVLLTYESKVVKDSVQADDEYKNNLKTEMKAAYEKMRTTIDEKYQTHYKTALPITIHIILIPLKEKAVLIESLHKRLKALQI